LLDGAFSVSRTSASAANFDRAFLHNFSKWLLPGDISGFLLRSDIVPGWPKVHVAAADKTLLRRDVLGTDVMLCLFSGLIAKLEFSLDEEALHFGFEVPPDNPDALEWRSGTRSVAVPLRDATRRVVDISALAASIGQGTALTSADFASQTLATPQLVRFLAG
jgi:hypothetical protein